MELPNSAAKRRLARAFLACILWASFAGIATAQQIGLWQGRNGWEITLAKVPTKGIECTLSRVDSQWIGSSTLLDMG